MEAAAGERVHAPQLLPGGRAVLFAASTEPGNAGWDTGHIVVPRIETGERTVVHEGARMSPTGNESTATAQDVRIVVNWTEELKRLVP